MGCLPDMQFMRMEAGAADHGRGLEEIVRFLDVDLAEGFG
jgi:hypothetical protein